ncbi:OsmC family protein [Fulvivirga sp. M361]|nr:OsmC family protein [Fulvivirga sp. M361]TRX62770.1 OsmC family protein [Fulvivirga sp. M361]
MYSMQSEYLGSLRTQSKHLKSGEVVMSDAPVDNNGKGEAFSPTDLVSSALCSCMMTIMGILAAREDIDLRGLKANITKVMDSNPRKISEIRIDFSGDINATDIQKGKLQKAALNCPVALSLADSVSQKISFNF